MTQEIAIKIMYTQFSPIKIYCMTYFIIHNQDLSICAFTIGSGPGQLRRHRRAQQPELLPA